MLSASAVSSATSLLSSATSLLVPVVASALVHVAAFGVLQGQDGRANHAAVPARNLVRSVSMLIPPLHEPEPPPPPEVAPPPVTKPEPKPEAVEKASPPRKARRINRRRARPTKPATESKPTPPAPAAPAIASGPGSLAMDVPVDDSTAPAVATAPPRTAPAPVAEYDLGGYGDGIHSALLAERMYPDEARDLELEGETLVMIRVHRDGTLAGRPVVAKSSGHPCLDREALRMVTAAAPFAKLPDGYAHPTAEFTIPVQFELADEF